MEQFRNFVRLRIDTRQVRTLVQIAIDAGESKIVEAVGISYVGSGVKRPYPTTLRLERG